MNFIGIRILFLAFLLVGCLPEQATRTTTADETISTDSPTNSTDTDEVTGETPSFSEPVNFFEQNGTRTTATQALFANYQDSFLIRGNDIFSYLSDVTKIYQSNFCIVTEFPTATGSNSKNILVMSARIRSFFSSFLNAKEYFLQIDPNNKTINQNDCVTVSLAQKIQDEYGVSSYALTLDEVCPDCNFNIDSQSLRLFDIFAQEQTQASISHLSMRIVYANSCI